MRLNNSQTSIIFMYEVVGRLLLTLMNMVVSTSMQVRFTVITAWKRKRMLKNSILVIIASKKNVLKKLVAKPITFSKIVGKKTVKNVPKQKNHIKNCEMK